MLSAFWSNSTRKGPSLEPSDRPGRQAQYVRAQGRENASDVAQPSTCAKIHRFQWSGHGATRSVSRRRHCHKSASGSWATSSWSVRRKCAFWKGHLWSTSLQVEITIILLSLWNSWRGWWNQAYQAGNHYIQECYRMVLLYYTNGETLLNET